MLPPVKPPLTSYSSRPSTSELSGNADKAIQNSQLEVALSCMQAQLYEEAFAILLELAVANLAPAKHALGQMYQHGWGTMPDFQQAKLCYEDAAELGFPQAFNSLGRLHQYGECDVEINCRVALNYYVVGVEKGAVVDLENLHALQQQYGVMPNHASTNYHNQSPPPYPHGSYGQNYQSSAPSGNHIGEGAVVVVNDCPIYVNAPHHPVYAQQPTMMVSNPFEPYSDAFNPFVPNSFAFRPFAAHLQLNAHQTIPGVQQISHMYFVESSEKEKNPDEYYEQGYKFETGIGGIQDDSAALHNYQLGVRKHSALAHVGMGRLYQHGCEVKQDYAIATYYYQKACKLGLSTSNLQEAILAITEMQKQQDSLKNEGSRSDFYRYYESANAGNPVAQYHLGLMYKEGDYVKQSDTNMELYLTLAYNNEHAEPGLKKDAAFALGESFEGRSFLRKDIDSALEWYIKASKCENKKILNDSTRVLTNAEGAFRAATLMIKHKKERDKEIPELLIRAYSLGHPLAASKLSDWYETRSFFSSEQDKEQAQYWKDVSDVLTKSLQQQ